jgi:hypothetical protein
VTRTNLATRVHSGGHYFEYEDGSPFFYLADTAWLLFGKLKEEEIRKLFDDRAAKGFNAVQACVFRDLHTPNTANAYGEKPFATHEDMMAVRMNPKWIDYVVRMTKVAAEYGLIMTLLPTWGDKWNKHSNSAGPVIMDATSGRAYCKFLSDALGDCPNVIWALGGDSPINSQYEADVIRAMGEGLREGRSRDRLVTFYPTGLGSSEMFHSESWLDFNALQTSHFKPNVPGYLYIERLFSNRLAKPCLDMEPNYETAPMFVFGEPSDLHRFKYADLPYVPQFTAYDVRKSYYRTVLAGAAGFTYGNESIRQVFRKGDRIHLWDVERIVHWDEALSSSGSFQLAMFADVLKSRSYWTRVPAQELFMPFRQDKAWPDRMATGLDFVGQQNLDPASRISVARCSEGTYVMAYMPIRNIITLNTSSISSGQLRVSIYDPETCQIARQFECKNDGRLQLAPERDLDSLIVIDGG